MKEMKEKNIVAALDALKVHQHIFNIDTDSEMPFESVVVKEPPCLADWINVIEQELKKVTVEYGTTMFVIKLELIEHFEELLCPGSISNVIGLTPPRKIPPPLEISKYMVVPQQDLEHEFFILLFNNDFDIVHKTGFRTK